MVLQRAAVDIVKCRLIAYNFSQYAGFPGMLTTCCEYAVASACNPDSTTSGLVVKRLTQANVASLQWATRLGVWSIVAMVVRHMAEHH